MSRSPWEAETGRRLGRLALAVGVLAVIWLAVLPAVGSRPAVRRFIDHNRQCGINPSAKFYTELPAMPEIHRHMEELRRRCPSPAW